VFKTDAEERVVSVEHIPEEAGEAAEGGEGESSEPT
jgi:hypothetical protein